MPLSHAGANALFSTAEGLRGNATGRYAHDVKMQGLSQCKTTVFRVQSFPPPIPVPSPASSGFSRVVGPQNPIKRLEQRAFVHEGSVCASPTTFCSGPVRESSVRARVGWCANLPRQCVHCLVWESAKAECANPNPRVSSRIRSFPCANRSFQCANPLPVGRVNG